ncbi:MAG: hypothetical protein AAB250_18430 [Bdellovibrionota bacterium]
MAVRLKVKHELVRWFGAGLVAAFAFQNCAPMDFEQASEKVGGLDTNEEILANEEIVAKSCESSQIYTQVATVNFPRPQKVFNSSRCDWNNDGNLDRVNNQFQARLEQKQTLTLPPNAKVCDVKFASPSQDWLYDDHVFVMMDNVLLASSHPIHTELPLENGLSIFDWSNIMTKQWTQIPAYVWCAGAGPGVAACEWPASQTTGQIKLNFPSTVFQKIVARDLTRNNHEIKFVTTGDNDPDSDCDHSDLTFDLEVKYSY